MKKAGGGKPPSCSNEQQVRGIEQPFGHRFLPEGLFCF